MDGCIDGWVDERMEGWMNGWMNEWKNEWILLKFFYLNNAEKFKKIKVTTLKTIWITKWFFFTFQRKTMLTILSISSLFCHIIYIIYINIYLYYLSTIYLSIALIFKLILYFPQSIVTLSIVIYISFFSHLYIKGICSYQCSDLSCSLLMTAWYSVV